MERLPEPPDRFSVAPDFRDVPAGTALWRIYFRGGAHPTAWNEFRHWGPTSSRFDHHTTPRRVQSRAILYAAAGTDAVLTALAEVFQDARLVDRRRNEPWLAGFQLSHPVKLLDTTGLWPVRAGGSMAINSGSRARARDWSRAVYRTYDDAHGVAYPSSIVNRPALALYERAEHAVPAHPVFHQPLAHPGLAAGLLAYAKRLRYALR